MNIDNSIDIKVFEEVYNPSDDSYLLLNSLDIQDKKNILEIGCGSGIIALHIAKQGVTVTAADISNYAVSNTKFNANHNQIQLNIVQSNLFENIRGKYDMIIFNPPYLPTANEHTAWDGGNEGLNIIQPFLDSARYYLLDEGIVYIIISNLTDRKKMIENNNAIYDFEIISKKKFFFESLFVYKITVNEKVKSF